MPYNPLGYEPVPTMCGGPIYSMFASTEFWSAIIGAIVGGVIALIAQLIALRAERKHREEDHKRAQQALGTSLLFKMTRIYSDFVNTHRHIEDHCKSAQERNLTGELWQFVPPLANPPPLVHFTSDEMGMLIGLKDNDLFNALVSLDEVHNGMVETIKVYKELRLALAERMPAPMSWQGTTFVGALTHKQLATLRPLMVNVESVITQLRSGTTSEAKVSGDVLDRLAALLRDRLGLTYKFERLPVEQASASADATPGSE
jgi:hypothetical protein